MAAGLASANSINGVCTQVGPEPTELGTPASPGTISCSGFNTALGTLEDVTITLSGAIVNITGDRSTITLINSNSSSQTASGTTIAKMYLTTALAGFSFGSSITTPAYAVDASTGLVTIPADTSETFQVSGSGSAGPQTDSNPATFGNYETTFDIDFATKTTLSTGGGGGFGGASQTTYADSTAEVSYTYIPTGTTPEPGTMGLLGGALVALGLVSKRRKRA